VLRLPLLRPVPPRLRVLHRLLQVRPVLALLPRVLLLRLL
jgi:hypothetical protein